MNKIEKLKNLYVCIYLYFGFLFWTLLLLSLVSVILLYIDMLKIYILYCYLIWLFFIGLGGLLLSFIDDYKWSLFHLDCKLKRKNPTVINFEKWEKENNL